MATLLKRNMRLFGIPYQFTPSVDPRIPTISDTVGKKFAENIIMDAPVITIMPGKPKYLPGVSSSDKQTVTHAFIDAASDLVNPLKAVLENASNDGDLLKYYDFESSYTEYKQYVNILCRTCASFLEIKETIDGESCQRYDYSKYKWNTDVSKGRSSTEKIFNAGVSSISNALNTVVDFGKDVINGIGSILNITSSDTNVTSNTTSNELKYETSSDSLIESAEDILTNYNYVQFFIDATTTDETMSNNVGDSKIKGLLDGTSDMLKEVAFIVNSGGADASFIDNMADGLADSLQGAVDGLVTDKSVNGVLSKVLNLTKNVAKGENIIMPQVYQNSSYDKSYSFTVHLKTPYGTKFGYFMDICVPLMHLLALGIPKQTTANTYGSPFLVKAYCEGMFTCNMGMVTTISVSRGVNNSFSVDGLPTEVDVTVNIQDLYSDLSMSPQSSPLLFANNSSLIEYLATTCGLSLITPNIQARLNMLTDTIVNAFDDIDDNIMSSITEKVDGYLKDFFKLTNW